MTYWFTVAKTGQRKPLHQICTCSKTMLQISLELCPRLVMVLMESRVLNQFKIFKLLQTLYYSMHPATIRLQSMLKKHYSQTSSLRCLKPVILRENDIQREEIQCYHKNICLSFIPSALFLCIKYSVQRSHFQTQRYRHIQTERSHFESPFLLNPKPKTNLCN